MPIKALRLEGRDEAMQMVVGKDLLLRINYIELIQFKDWILGHKPAPCNGQK